MNGGRNKYDFSIVVVSYNQERFVVEALESIRYQIVNNSYSGSVQLIVADDGSTDKTQQRIRMWTEKYKHLFADIVLILSDLNEGTTKNVAKAFEKIDANRFYSFAADDLLSPDKVFEIVSKYDDNVIAIDVPYIMRDSKISVLRKYYVSNVMNYFRSARYFVWKSQIGNAIVNGTIVGKGIVNEEVINFSKRCKLLDDQARYLFYFSNFSNVSFEYEYVPVLLYRKSDINVTNIKGEHYNTLIEDKRVLVKYLLNNSSSILLKIGAIYELEKMKHPNFFRYLPFFNNASYRYVFGKIVFHTRMKEIMCRLLNEDRVAHINSYIEYIVAESDAFVNLCNDTL